MTDQRHKCGTQSGMLQFLLGSKIKLAEIQDKLRTLQLKLKKIKLKILGHVRDSQFVPQGHPARGDDFCLLDLTMVTCI